MNAAKYAYELTNEQKLEQVRARRAIAETNDGKVYLAGLRQMYAEKLESITRAVSVDDLKQIQIEARMLEKLINAFSENELDKQEKLLR